MSFRVGQGFDVHAFGKGDQVTLGGVSIPFDRGLRAHSDGDVLLHAVMDALLGALALGDIGKHFPDTDARFQGADSRVLLRAVMTLLYQRGFRPVNIDTVVIAERPRLSVHIDAMRTNISDDCGLPIDRVSVKATTTEGLGFAGRCEGIAAQAIVLLESASS